MVEYNNETLVRCIFRNFDETESDKYSFHLLTNQNSIGGKVPCQSNVGDRMNELDCGLVWLFYASKTDHFEFKLCKCKINEFSIISEEDLESYHTYEIPDLTFDQAVSINISWNDDYNSQIISIDDILNENENLFEKLPVLKTDFDNEETDITQEYNTPTSKLRTLPDLPLRISPKIKIKMTTESLDSICGSSSEVEEIMSHQSTNKLNVVLSAKQCSSDPASSSSDRILSDIPAKVSELPEEDEVFACKETEDGLIDIDKLLLGMATDSSNQNEEHIKLNLSMPDPEPVKARPNIIVAKIQALFGFGFRPTHTEHEEKPKTTVKTPEKAPQDEEFENIDKENDNMIETKGVVIGDVVIEEDKNNEQFVDITEEDNKKHESTLNVDLLSDNDKRFEGGDTDYTNKLVDGNILENSNENIVDDLKNIQPIFNNETLVKSNEIPSNDNILEDTKSEEVRTAGQTVKTLENLATAEKLSLLDTDSANLIKEIDDDTITSEKFSCKEKIHILDNPFLERVEPLNVDCDYQNEERALPFAIGKEPSPEINQTIMDNGSDFSLYENSGTIKQEQVLLTSDFSEIISESVEGALSNMSSFQEVNAILSCVELQPFKQLAAVETIPIVLEGCTESKKEESSYLMDDRNLIDVNSNILLHDKTLINTEKDSELKTMRETSNEKIGNQIPSTFNIDEVINDVFLCPVEHTSTEDEGNASIYFEEKPSSGNFEPIETVSPDLKETLGTVEKEHVATSNIVNSVASVHETNKMKEMADFSPKFEFKALPIFDPDGKDLIAKIVPNIPENKIEDHLTVPEDGENQISVVNEDNEIDETSFEDKEITEEKIQNNQHGEEIKGEVGIIDCKNQKSKLEEKITNYENIAENKNQIEQEKEITDYTIPNLELGDEMKDDEDIIVNLGVDEEIINDKEKENHHLEKIIVNKIQNSQLEEEITDNREIDENQKQNLEIDEEIINYKEITDDRKQDSQFEGIINDTDKMTAKEIIIGERNRYYEDHFQEIISLEDKENATNERKQDEIIFNKIIDNKIDLELDYECFSKDKIEHQIVAPNHGILPESTSLENFEEVIIDITDIEIQRIEPTDSRQEIQYQLNVDTENISNELMDEFKYISDDNEHGRLKLSERNLDLESLSNYLGTQSLDAESNDSSLVTSLSKDSIDYLTNDAGENIEEQKSKGFETSMVNDLLTNCVVTVDEDPQADSNATLIRQGDECEISDYAQEISFSEDQTESGFILRSSLPVVINIYSYEDMLDKNVIGTENSVNDNALLYKDNSVISIKDSAIICDSDSQSCMGPLALDDSYYEFTSNHPMNMSQTVDSLFMSSTTQTLSDGDKYRITSNIHSQDSMHCHDGNVDPIVKSTMSLPLPPPMALNQSSSRGVDYGNELRLTCQGVSSVNDDDLFPDSVTPTKADSTLRMLGSLYDIPYIDDEPYLLENDTPGIACQKHERFSKAKLADCDECTLSSEHELHQISREEIASPILSRKIKRGSKLLRCCSCFTRNRRG